MSQNGERICNMTGIEEKIEDMFKRRLDDLRVRRYGKTEAIGPAVRAALESAVSKSGGTGGNFPDIRALLDDGRGRRIPVMMECKGQKNKLEKLFGQGRRYRRRPDVPELV